MGAESIHDWPNLPSWLGWFSPAPPHLVGINKLDAQPAGGDDLALYSFQVYLHNIFFLKTKLSLLFSMRMPLLMRWLVKNWRWKDLPDFRTHTTLIQFFCLLSTPLRFILCFIALCFILWFNSVYSLFYRIRTDTSGGSKSHAGYIDGSLLLSRWHRKPD